MSGQTERAEESRARLDLQAARVNLAGAAVSLAVLFWYLTPEHKRQQAVRRLRRAVAPAVRAVLAEAHQQALRRAMAREAETGVEDYALSVRLHGWWQRWEQP